MVLDNSDLSKTKASETLGEGYILLFENYNSSLNCKQYDAPTYARRALNLNQALSHSSLAKLSESAGGVHRALPMLVFFAIL